MSSFSDRELIWTEQFLGWENTKQSGKAQMTVSARKRCRIGTGKQAMEAETRSRPVSIALLLKLASSQTENEREKQSDSPWSWADDGQRKERCQLKDKARATWWERGERQALSPGRVIFLGLKAAEKWGLGETIHQTTHAEHAWQGNLPAPAPALTAGDTEERQQNHPSRKVKGSRRAKVAGFAFPRPEVTCVTYALLPPTLLSSIKLICHDVSQSAITFLTTSTHFLLRPPRALGWLHHLAHPCRGLTHRGSRISFTHLHMKGFRGNHLAQKWPLSMEGSESEKSVPLHLHTGNLGPWSDNSKWLVNSSHEEY